MRVLIVDDSKAMRMIVARELRSAGFAELLIAEASSGAEAISVMKDFNPELVLSDWNMPEMDGMELLVALRARANTVRFGFVTTEGTPRMRESAKAAGADFLIAKPFTIEAFRDAIGAVLIAA